LYEPGKFHKEKSKFDANEARRYAHAVFMKQKLNQLPFDEQFR
jgi:hypothetical protein